MITFEILLKSSLSYFPLVLCVILKVKCILLLNQNFGKLNLWMQISFIIFMIEKTAMCVHACVHLLTFSLKKPLLRNY